MQDVIEEDLIIAFKNVKLSHLMDIETLVREVKHGKLQLVLTIRDSVVEGMEVISKQYIRYDKGETIMEKP